MRRSLLGLVLLSTAPARADVTVVYAPPAPLGALVAEVVTGPTLEAEPVPEPDPVPPVPASTPRAPEPEAPVAVAPSSADAPPDPEAGEEPAREPAPVRFVRVGDENGEEVSVRLLDDAGRPSPEGLTALSVLARPRGIAPPSDEVLAAHASDLEWVAPSIRRLHPGLLRRLAAIAEHFRDRSIEIVSGYRPDARDTSRHRIGSALDLRVVGVPAETLDAFLTTLPETGVGLYPTSGFVHVDVRPAATHWVDVSGPGETARAPTSTGRSEGEMEEGAHVDEAAIRRAVSRGLRGVGTR